MKTLILAHAMLLPLPIVHSSGTFAWISDTHLDQFYRTPTAEIHGGQTGKRIALGLPGDPPCNTTNAPKYSTYGCGGSIDLVTAAVSAASTATNKLNWPPIDFVLFTGDNTRHNSPTPEAVLENIATVQNLFKEYFPNTTVVQLPTLDLGNNDFTSDYYLKITSHKACLPTVTSLDLSRKTSVELPKSTNEWLETVAKQQKSMFATELEYATFACGGYLNHAVSDKLHIIVMNTIVWDLSHKPDDGDQDDPFGQFEWLDKQLSDLRAAGNKVYLTGHIPPMLQSYTGSIGKPLYKKEKEMKLIAIVSEYHDVIAGIFVAHVHSNELRHMPPFVGDAPPMLVGGSIAPGYTTNPVFSIVKYDKDGTSYPTDLASFAVDYANQEMLDNKNPFEVTVPSLLEYLELESLTNSEVLKLSNKMMPGSGTTDDVIWNRYFNNWYKGVPQIECDDCQRGEACLVACGFGDSPEWQSCNASSNGLTTWDACNQQASEADESSASRMESTRFMISLAYAFVCAASLTV